MTIEYIGEKCDICDFVEKYEIDKTIGSKPHTFTRQYYTIFGLKVCNVCREKLIARFKVIITP
jgi:hypothetical protein